MGFVLYEHKASQVATDLEEWHIMGQELAEVDVDDGPEHQHKPASDIMQARYLELHDYITICPLPLRKAV
jgi:hypothetical protein